MFAWLPIIGIGVVVFTAYEAWCLLRVYDEAEVFNNAGLDKVGHCYAVCRAIRGCKLPADTALWWANWVENRWPSIDWKDDELAHLYGSGCAVDKACQSQDCEQCCRATAGTYLPNY